MNMTWRAVHAAFGRKPVSDRLASTGQSRWSTAVTDAAPAASTGQSRWSTAVTDAAPAHRSWPEADAYDRLPTAMLFEDPTWVLCKTRRGSTQPAPLFLRSDNGPEFVSVAVLEWLPHAGIGTALIEGQALAERQRRELQWQAARRVPERRVVPIACRNQGRHRNLAPSLQRRSTPQQLELLDAAGVQAAASPSPQPSRLPGMVGPNYQGQVSSP